MLVKQEEEDEDVEEEGLKNELHIEDEVKSKQEADGR